MSYIYIVKTPTKSTLHDTLDGAMTAAMALYDSDACDEIVYVLKVEQCEAIKIELIDRLKKGDKNV
jgi:hypothetical protein